MDSLQKALLDIGVFGAVEVGDSLVNFCVTEKVAKEELDRVVEHLKSVLYEVL